MAPATTSVLAINGGSSSVKFAVYRGGTSPTPSLSGTLDRIGRGGTTLSWRAKEGASFEGHTEVPDDTPAPRLLIDWLEASLTPTSSKSLPVSRDRRPHTAA